MIIFVFLFYQSYPGINVLLFEIALVVLTLFIFPKHRFSLSRVIGTSALIITAVAFLWNGSGWSLFVNILCYFLFIGTVIAPITRSLFTNAQLGLYNLLGSPFQLLIDLSRLKISNAPRLNRIIRYYYLVVPALIIGFFILIYSASNPIFNKLLNDVFGGLFNWFWEFADTLNAQLIATWLFGLVISIYSFIHYSNFDLIHIDANSSDHLARVRLRINRSYKRTGLKSEWYAALFLLTALNLLILVINLIDIYWVWFNFEWEGEYLKQFVHSGTYLLILSILLSMAIVLYFFRGNLNFLSRNHRLKLLCYIWLGQNAILAISVAIRNLHYIHYFALASKRIGVMFFIALVLVGIFTVFLKVQKKKSVFYLLRMNMLAVIVAFVISSLPNWDRIIIEYNFNHYNESFVHFDYLATFDANNLSYLDRSMEELNAIESVQTELFPFEETYMTAEEYAYRIQEKKTELEVLYEQRTWQEWTMARQRAFTFIGK